MPYNSEPTGTTNCKVTYVAPEGSQIAINFLEMDMQEPKGKDVDCASIDEHIELTEPEITPSGSLGRETMTC